MLIPFTEDEAKDKFGHHAIVLNSAHREVLAAMAKELEYSMDHREFYICFELEYFADPEPVRSPLRRAAIELMNTVGYCIRTPCMDRLTSFSVWLEYNISDFDITPSPEAVECVGGESRLADHFANYARLCWIERALQIGIWA